MVARFQLARLLGSGRAFQVTLILELGEGQLVCLASWEVALGMASDARRRRRALRSLQVKGYRYNSAIILQVSQNTRVKQSFERTESFLSFLSFGNQMNSECIIQHQQYSTDRLRPLQLAANPNNALLSGVRKSQLVPQVPRVPLVY